MQETACSKPNAVNTSTVVTKMYYFQNIYVFIQNILFEIKKKNNAYLIIIIIRRHYSYKKNH